MNQSELESRLVLVLPLIGGEIGQAFFNQSQSVEEQNQIKAKITFGVTFKSAPNISICEFKLIYMHAKSVFVQVHDVFECRCCLLASLFVYLFFWH